MKPIKLWVDAVDIHGAPMPIRVVGEASRPLRNGLPCGRIVAVQARGRKDAEATYRRFKRAEDLGEEGIRDLRRTDPDAAVALYAALDAVQVLEVTNAGSR